MCYKRSRISKCLATVHHFTDKAIPKFLPLAECNTRSVVAKTSIKMACSNASSVFSDSFRLISESSFLQFYLAYSIFFLLFGLCSNLLILYVVKKNKKLHNLGSAFICNLAISDLSVLFLGDGFTLVGILTQGKILIDNPSLCIWSSCFCLVACFCSFWNIAGASLHTYLHVCHRFVYLKQVNATKIAFAIACIWIGCVLLLAPSVFGWGAHVYDPKVMFCVFEYTFYAPYTLSLVVFGIVLPLALVACAYVGIAKRVTESRNKLRCRLKEISPGFIARFPHLCTPGINQVEKRLIRSLKYIAVYVGVTWLFLMVMWIMGDKKTWNINEAVPAALLAHSHCGINAVLYIATNKHVRIEVKNIFRRADSQSVTS